MTTPTRYDNRSITLHWASALLVFALWVLGQTMDLFPGGEPRADALSVHIVFGAALALMLAYRILWRLTGGLQLPPADAGPGGRIALFAHRALYVLLIVAVVSGGLNAWERGDTIFGFATIPSFAPGNSGLSKTIDYLHALASNCLLGLVAVHTVAVVLHHVVRKDGVLDRMMPLRQR